MFSVELGHRNHSSDSSIYLYDESRPIIEIELPSTAYELLDALDRAGFDPESDMRFRYVEGEYSYLAPKLEDLDDLVILNEAAKVIAEMDTRQMIALNALAQRETDGWKKELSASGLYDLACAAGHCRVVEDVTDLSALGKHAMREGLVPELESVPDEVKNMMDFGNLGYRIQAKEHGIFVHDKIGCAIPDKGYAVPCNEIRELSAGLDVSLRPPAYSMRVSARCFAA